MSSGRKRRAGLGVVCLAALLAPVPALADALDPLITVPARPAMHRFTGIPPAVELVGLDLAQRGDLVRGEPPVIEPPAPLDLTLYLRPLRIPVAGSTLRLMIRRPGSDEAPSYIADLSLPAGDWRIGVVEPVPWRMPLPVRRAVGDCILSVAQIREGEPWQARAVLAQVPVRVPAVTWSADIPREPLRDAFGDAAVSLRTGFRLAPGASVTVPVPEPARTETAALGLIAYMLLAADAEQGTPVCRVELRDAAGAVAATVPVRAGVHTALRAYDPAAPPAHKQAPVAITEQQGRGDARETVYQYAGRIEVAPPVTPASLTFTWLLDEGLLDVRDLALIPPREELEP
jgi:hypothetical protein